MESTHDNQARTHAARPVAVIDVGATAMRLRIAELQPDGGIRSLDQIQQAVRLGKDTFTHGFIKPSTIEECVTILLSFRRVLKEYGITQPEQIRAVATSAVREAQNRDAFLDRLYMATQINVEAIEGPVENRLTYIAVQDVLETEPTLKNSDTAIAEVGGGSTDLIFVREGRVTFSGTYRLGSLRLRETLETYRTPVARVRSVLEQQIRRSVDQLQRSAPVKTITCLVALSGDARFVASRIEPNWEENQVCRIPLKKFMAVAEPLISMPVDELVRRHHIPHQEAETIGPALLVYEHLAVALQVQEILVTRASLRDGLLREMALRGAWTTEYADQAMSAARLMSSRYNVDESHAERVANFCLRLFRELQREHALDERYALQLRIAALLHEVGRFISDRSHHKHSMYIVMNSDLFGLAKRDLALIGLVTRYHRRAMPQTYHTEYTALDRESRIIVVKLAALLRIADAIDRRRVQPLEKISFSRVGDDFVITVNEPADLTLETLALKEKANLFEQVFGMKVVLRSAIGEAEVFARG